MNIANVFDSCFFVWTISSAALQGEETACEVNKKGTLKHSANDSHAIGSPLSASRRGLHANEVMSSMSRTSAIDQTEMSFIAQDELA